MSEHEGNPIKAVFNPETGITSNYIASSPEIPVPDTKYDPNHGHYDVNQSGDTTYQRDPK